MKISIVNPLQGGQRYTSPKRAQQFVRRGLAVMDSNGYLRFLERNQQARLHQLEQSILAGRGGVVYWNGSKHPNSMHLPGQVKS